MVGFSHNILHHEPLPVCSSRKEFGSWHLAFGISLSIFIFGTESSMCLKCANGGGGEVEARWGATVGIHPNRFKV